MKQWVLRLGYPFCRPSSEENVAGSGLRVAPIFDRFQILREGEKPVYKSCLPLQNGCKIFLLKVHTSI